ncbi:Uma2 family endonuclease [bacterium]|nr:Uma2 family endonuclease [bacterium]
MTTATTPAPAPTAAPVTYGDAASMRRFTVAQYDRMINDGIIDDTDRVELLEGYVVLKMPGNPEHDGAVQAVADAFYARRPAGWCYRVQLGVRLADSEPQPDFAVVRAPAGTYRQRHPEPADIGLLVEVANTSLVRDTQDKVRMYATAGVPEYWVIDVTNRLVIAYRQPAGAAYATRTQYGPADAVPFAPAGTHVADIPAAELLG